MANNGKLPWLVVYLLFIAMVIAYIHRVDLSSALPLMSDEFGWSATQLGQASSAFFWIYFMLQIPAGYATDRWGVHFVFWAGLRRIVVKPVGRPRRGDFLFAHDRNHALGLVV